MNETVTAGTPAGAPQVRGPLAVVVVDRSPAQRRLLRSLIDADPELTVVGEGRTGKEAVALVERLRPAVVLMDLDLPVMSGIEAIERIMAGRPTPILVYAGDRSGDPAGDQDSAHDGGLAAIAAGAVDVVPRPGTGDGTVQVDGRYAETLRRRLRVASRIRVITHPRGRLRGQAAGGGVAAAASRTIAALDPPAPGGCAPAPGAPVPHGGTLRAAADPAPTRRFDLIAMGVSTGGPQALALLLRALPASLEQAVVVVQHMADGFLEGLATWLDSQCALPVRVGEHGGRLQPGTVTLAPGGRNLVVHERLRTTCEVPPPSQFHIPGIDVTFSSIAASIGPAAIGVILTGMGRDGAAGLKDMRDRGAVTVAQDEATSAVYGMPGAAMAIGAVDFEYPLHGIAPFLLSLVAPPSDGSRP